MNLDILPFNNVVLQASFIEGQENWDLITNPLTVNHKLLGIYKQLT